MSQATIAERVKREIASTIGITEKEVIDDATLESLGADSLDVIEVVMAIEEEFSIEISEEDGEKLTTVQQFIDYVTERAG